MSESKEGSASTAGLVWAMRMTLSLLELGMSSKLPAGTFELLALEHDRLLRDALAADEAGTDPNVADPSGERCQR